MASPRRRRCRWIYVYCSQSFEPYTTCTGPLLGQVAGIAVCPADTGICAAFTAAYLDGHCDYTSGNVNTKVAGPLCYGTAADWIDAHPSECPTI